MTAAEACRSTADRGNGRNRCAAETGQHVGKRLQSRWSGRQACGFLQRREEIVVRQEEAFDGAIEDDDLHVLIGFERHDDLVKLWDRLGSENIERWVIERNSPIRWQAPFQPDLLCRG